jgi:hypothetical protein
MFMVDAPRAIASEDRARKMAEIGAKVKARDVARARARQIFPFCRSSGGTNPALA